MRYLIITQILSIYLAIQNFHHAQAQYTVQYVASLFYTNREVTDQANIRLQDSTRLLVGRSCQT